MRLANRIEHLTNTPLPEDLLKRLYNAKQIPEQEEKATEVNSIEVECFKRGIYIHYPAPAPITNHVLGRLIDTLA